MKVLFAVNDEKDAEAITRVYQKEYKEIISSKTVYYFNAIIKELQKDKTYDRIVISEDLEMFSSDNYQAVDKFIFEKMDAISDEATNVEGNDIPIILLCMDRRTKNDPLLVKLFGLGLYNVLIGQDRSIQKVAALMYKPRTKKEAKAYYKVEAENVGYTTEDKNGGVNETEIQNILNHYKKIGENVPKCVQSFESIMSQYSKEQVKLIAEILPKNTKVILEENSDSYRKLMGIKGEKAVGASQLRKTEYVEKEIDSGNRLTQPVIIPTAVNTKQVNKVLSAEELKKKKLEEARKKAKEKLMKERAEAKKRAEDRKKAEEEARKKEEERIAREKAEEEARKKEERIARKKAEEEARKKEEERIARKKAEEEAKKKEKERIAREKAEAAAKKKAEEKAKKEAKERLEKQKAEAEAKKKAEEEIKRKEQEKMAEEKLKVENDEPVVKRGRGRPRKNTVVPVVLEDVPVKRKRGRPRKNPVEDSVEKVEEKAEKITKANVKDDINETVSPKKNNSVEDDDLFDFIDFDDTVNQNVSNEKQKENEIEEVDLDLYDDFDDFSDFEDESDKTDKNEQLENNNDSQKDAEDEDFLPGLDDSEDNDDYEEDSYYDDDEEDFDDEDEDFDYDSVYGQDDNELTEQEESNEEDTEENNEDDDNDFLPGFDDDDVDDYDDYDFDDDAEDEKDIDIAEEDNEAEVENDEESYDENDEFEDYDDDDFDYDEDEFDYDDYEDEEIADDVESDSSSDEYDDEDDFLPGFDDDEDEDNNSEEYGEVEENVENEDNDNNVDEDVDEDDFLPGFDDVEDINNDEDYDFVDDDEKVESETDAEEEVENATEIDETDETQVEDTLPGFEDENVEEDVDDTENNNEDIQYNGAFKGINNKNYKYDNNLANSIKDLKEPENTTSTYNIETDNLITSDQKVVSFVGTSKNGTSFIVNNLAELYSNQGIKTAILDLTKNKNAYYVYTNNEEDLREKAHDCIEKLSAGIADGIQVNKNLTVYTSLPGEDGSLDDVTDIIKTLLENYSIVLLDCDFETDARYFKIAQELYLVQSWDVLTIQPLTAFLRDLKVKNILETNKLRIIINKDVKIGSISEKALIGGMSSYSDPAMTYMTELFNRDTIKYITVPFDNQVYAKYLEGIANCKISTKGYSKSFISSMNRLSDMVYPTVSGKKSKKQYNDYTSQNKQFENTFSKDTSSTLYKMKKKY